MSLALAHCNIMQLEIPQLLKSKLAALLFSGGKESLLLLDMVRQVRPSTTIVHFYDRLAPEVEAVIKGWDLEVLSWRPAAWYLVPWGSGVVLVNEYSFGDARLPVLTDIIDGEDCEWEKRPTNLTEFFDNPFDLVLWGMRKSDELHPVMPAYFERKTRLGASKLFAPLYNWPTEDVVEAVNRLPFAPVANDAIRMCAKCREGLANWDREAALKMFSERFNYAKAA